MRDRAMICQDVTVRRKPGLISAGSDDELTLLDVDHGDFVQLNKTAAAIWTLLDEPMTVAALCARLAESFAIMADDCREDVTAFIASLGERGLVELSLPPHG